MLETARCDKFETRWGPEVLHKPALEPLEGKDSLTYWVTDCFGAGICKKLKIRNKGLLEAFEFRLTHLARLEN